MMRNFANDLLEVGQLRSSASVLKDRPRLAPCSARSRAKTAGCCATSMQKLASAHAEGIMAGEQQRQHLIL